jgi:hypothetical protein
MAQLQAVDVVAITAPHLVVVHLALRERSPHVDLIQDLTIGVVETSAQQCRNLAVEQGDTGVVVISKLRAS